MSRRNSNDGVALIMVLWTIVIMSFLLLSLSEDIQLESFLTRNLMDQMQVDFVAQAGIARGMAEIRGDRTLADGKTEPWMQPINGQIDDRGTFQIAIEDIGCRININYIGDPLLPALVTDFAKEFAAWRRDKFPVCSMQELKEFPNFDFKSIENKITFYGKFNLNTDDYTLLKEIMLKKRISEWTADTIIEDLKRAERPILSLDELPLKVPSMDLSTLGMIRDDVEVRGSININLVSEELLVKILTSYNVQQDQITYITTLREKETIANLEKLVPVIGEYGYNHMSPLFDVTSRYLRITCMAKSTVSSIEKKIIIEVERIPDKVAQGRVLEWRTKILSWVES